MNIQQPIFQMSCQFVSSSSAWGKVSSGCLTWMTRPQKFSEFLILLRRGSQVFQTPHHRPGNQAAEHGALQFGASEIRIEKLWGPPSLVLYCWQPMRSGSHWVSGVHSVPKMTESLHFLNLFLIYASTKYSFSLEMQGLVSDSYLERGSAIFLGSMPKIPSTLTF